MAIGPPPRNLSLYPGLGVAAIPAGYIMTPAGTTIRPLDPYSSLHGDYPLGTEPPPQYIPMEEWDKAILYAPEAVSRTTLRYPNNNPDDLIRKNGYTQFDDMLTMSVYHSPLRLKQYGTLYKPWEVIPKYLTVEQAPKSNPHLYDMAQEAAELCHYVLDNIYDEEVDEKSDFRTTLWNMTFAYHAGHSIQEIVTRVIEGGRYNGMRGLARFVPRRPKQIGWNLDPTSLRVVSINNYTAAGWQTYIPPTKFLIYTYQGENGLPHGRGDMRACKKHVDAINTLMRQFGVALEKHGLGFLKAETSNPNKEHIAAVQLWMDRVAGGQSMVVPPGIKVELLMGLPNGAVQAFLQGLEYHESMIVKEILGQSLTTGLGDGKGSYALAAVHEGTQKFFIGPNRTDIERVVSNQLFHRIVKWNLGDDYLEVVPTLSLGSYDVSERNELADFFTKMIEVGIMHPQEGIIRKEVQLPPLDKTMISEAWDPTTIPLLPGKERIVEVLGGDKPSTSSQAGGAE